MTRLIAIASGKGGVGKTFLACSLGHALVQAGQPTLLFDADLGLANVDIQLGIDPTRDLAAVLRQGAPLTSIVFRHCETGLDLVAGRSGSGSLAGVEAPLVRRLCAELAQLAKAYAFVLLDLAAGLELPCRTFAAAADRVLLVTTDEPTALTDAYAFLKVACPRPQRAAVVVNLVTSHRRGQETFAILARACARFLGESPELAGLIRRDPRVSEAIRAQKPFLTRHPNAPAAEDIRALAAWLVDERHGGSR
jgi:flagellar biosynthesis protein FlhG